MTIATFELIYILLTIICIIMDLVCAKFCFDKNVKSAQYLGFVNVFASLVLVSYSTSIFTDVQTNYFGVSLFSSIYFLCIDIMLLCLLGYIIQFTNYKSKHTKIIICFVITEFIIDFISLGLNPFKEIAIHYAYRDTAIANFKYNMHILYRYHLYYSYSLVASFLVLTIRKIFTVPYNYRRQYIYILLGVLLIIFWNGLFLYMPGMKVYSFIDYSVFAYSIMMIFVYWTSYGYSKKGLLNSFKNTIFENINQGIVLFDYDKHFMMANSKMYSIFGDESFDESYTYEQFFEHYSLPSVEGNENKSFQCFLEGGYGLKPIRCDYRPLKNKKNQINAYLFVFTDPQLDIDLLTGFQSWESFQRYAVDNVFENDEKYEVTVFDINGLSDINKSLGRNEGDRMILQLANSIKKCFPKETFYIRGEEAHLIAISFNKTIDEIEAYILNVKNLFTKNFQYGIVVESEKYRDVLNSIQRATQSMCEKKMIDKSSKSSNVLTSLIQALKSCDADTEEHVNRTQIMGKKLGKRIGLTDTQHSDLALLCLLHDIGKIGVPLEILNKRGKLTEEEWKVIQSHVEKGYQIAKSSNELSRIADMILHHHERWDGKGYPDGLSRETIPLLSRIISVVDSYDAMVNDRSYRKALPKSVAIQELRKNAGTQYDPYIVSEFLLMIEEDDTVTEFENIDPLKEQIHNVRYEEVQAPLINVHTIVNSRYTIDEAMRIIEVDDNFEQLTGYSKKEIEQNELYQMDLIPEEDRFHYFSLVSQTMAKSDSAYFEHRLMRKDKTVIYVFCLGREYYDSVSRTMKTEIIVANSTNTYSMKQLASQEKEKATNRLKEWENKYRRDSLTGLLSHEAFQNDVNGYLLNSDYHTMLIMMDVDKFKEYNDTFGHRAGDEYLILVAQTIEETLRKEDLACRMGGDEFACAIFFENTVTVERMRERAVEIFDKINMTVTASHEGASLSMGIAIADENIRTFNQLYEEADKALYISKNRGRGRIS